MRYVIAHRNQAIGERIAAQLNSRGHDGITLEKGSSALQAIRRKAADVVIAASPMADLDGFGIAIAMRSERSLCAIPILLHTEYHDPTSCRALAQSIGATVLSTDSALSADAIARIEQAVASAARQKPPPAITADSASKLRDGHASLVNSTLIAFTEALDKVEHSGDASAVTSRVVAAALIQAEEEERTRVARELHDELGQSLAALKLDIARVQQEHAADSSEKPIDLSQLLSDVDQISAGMHDIAASLRPALLDDLGLEAAIKWLVDRVQKRLGIVCSVGPLGSLSELNAAKSSALYRIVQESLNNVVRHAEATSVSVSVRERAQAVIVIIEDNGKGINDESTRRMGAMGLLGMRERAHSVGGSLDIGIGSAGGTRVAATIPRAD